MSMYRRYLSFVFLLVLLITSSAGAITIDPARNFIILYDKNARAGQCQEGGLAIGSVPATTDLKSFVDAYDQSAFNVGKAYGIPYEAILAQGALESGYGKSQLTTQAYNFFGIKAGSSWSGPVVYFNTVEQRPDGSEYVVNAAFRVYASAEAGFQGYGDFITQNSRYATALRYPNDYRQYIVEIAKAGYATDVRYVEKVTSLASAIAKYISEKGVLPPSTEVIPDTARPTDGADAASSSGCSQDGSSDGSGIVAIAQREYAKRPAEWDANVLAYSDNNREAWCADFVSWVFKQANTPFTGGVSGGWRVPAAINVKGWFEQHGQYFAAGSAGAPQPGDVVFYGTDREVFHTNIVVSVSGNTMVTIGGNESNMVRQQTRSTIPGSGGLLGYGRLK